jgi:hypothetical protein
MVGRMRYLPVILLVALTIYALVDCTRYEDSEMPVGLPKAVWVILIVIFPAAGAIAWLVVSRVGRADAGAAARRPATGARPGPRPAGRPSPFASRRPAGPPAPDDDPEFLAALDQERRRRERERRAAEGGDGDVPGEPGAAEKRPDGDSEPGPAQA